MIPVLPAPPTLPQVRWTEGGTDTGSSGAALMEAASQQALGVLTGGEASACRNRDYFGSLAAVGGWVHLRVGLCLPCQLRLQHPLAS
jgi:hypothetical protein